MAISNLFGLIKDPLKAAYDKHGPAYREDLNTIGEFAKEATQPAVDFVANAPIVKSASAFLDNPTPQELGQQVANIGGAFSESAQQFVDDFQQMPLIGGMTAYHGTPHKIVGGFKKEAIGSGEGAQAFGHGFYATESKGIAEQYAKDLGGAGKITTSLGGRTKTIDTRKAIDRYGKNLSENDKAELEEFFRMVGSGEYKSLEAAKNDARMFAINGHPWGDAAHKIIRDAIEIKPTGRIYTLDIPEPDVMLDWDKPLKEQPLTKKVLVTEGYNRDITGFGDIDYKATKKWEGQITDEIKKLQNVLDSINNDLLVNPNSTQLRQKYNLISNDLTNKINELQIKTGQWHLDEKITGQELYKSLVDKFGTPEKASQYLHSIGIKGINYPAGSISGAKTSARNYVIFEPEDIKITAEEFLDK